MSTTNGGPAPAPQQQPQLSVVAQYIKDFSFENPNAPQSLTVTTQPQIDIQINVAAKPVAETDIEVTLKLEGKAENNGGLMFRFELEFAGVFRIQNVPQESMNRGRADRMPAPAVPVRARNRRHHRAQRRLPAAAARSGGFRRPLPPEDGRDAGRRRAAGAAELTYR